MIIDKSNLENADILCIWEGHMDKEGFGGKPSRKYVVRVPNYDVYVTAKSIRRIKESKQSYTKAYRLNTLRIGCIDGYIGESMLHGQYPGRKIYIVGQRYPDKDEYKI